jgi:hypothetical protein
LDLSRNYRLTADASQGKFLMDWRLAERIEIEYFDLMISKNSFDCFQDIGYPTIARADDFMMRKGCPKFKESNDMIVRSTTAAMVLVLSMAGAQALPVAKNTAATSPQVVQVKKAFKIEPPASPEAGPEANLGKSAAAKPAKRLAQKTAKKPFKIDPPASPEAGPEANLGKSAAAAPAKKPAKRVVKKSRKKAKKGS